MVKYRIMTEDKNRDGIRAILDKEFPGYTLIPGLGCWKGVLEPSLTIEVLPSGQCEHCVPDIVRDIAQRIKQVNKQESVMIERQEVEVDFV